LYSVNLSIHGRNRIKHQHIDTGSTIQENKLHHRKPNNLRHQRRTHRNRIHTTKPKLRWLGPRRHKIPRNTRLPSSLHKQIRQNHNIRKVQHIPHSIHNISRSSTSSNLPSIKRESKPSIPKSQSTASQLKEVMKTPQRASREKKTSSRPLNDTLKKSISVKILQVFCREEKYRKAQHVTLVTSANPPPKFKRRPPIFR
jgi:hypothetical protein